jgi:hypothetical protein
MRNEHNITQRKKKGSNWLAKVSLLCICSIVVGLGACSIRDPLTARGGSAVALMPSEVKRLPSDLPLDHLSRINLDAIPTASDVTAATQRGNYVEAAWMLRRVLEVHSDNARAHYIFAQVLVHQGKALSALGELNRAKELAPSHPYTSSEKFSRVDEYIMQNATTYRDRKALFTLVAGD